MTCSNELNGVRYTHGRGIVVLIGGVEVEFSYATADGKRTGFSWDWNTFDDGCQCVSCNALHDAYADYSVEVNYGNYNPVRMASLKRLGWMGDSSMVKMADGWVKTLRSPVTIYQEYPMGLVCCRCNSRNEYAGAEHLKDGKYVCYNCKCPASV